MKKRIHFLTVVICLMVWLSAGMTVFAKDESRYEAKQIILTDTVLDEYEGAKKVSTYPKYGQTVISFWTEKDTKEAYEKLLDIYGPEKCYLDRIYKASDLLMESSGATANAYKASSWGTTFMGMDYLKSNAKAYGINRKVTVAVIDTGINKDNAMFNGRKITGYNTMLGKAVYNDIAPQFPGHGTHVCGIIADATPSNVDFIVISTFDEDGDNTGGAMIEAFAYAIDHGADVINCCLGYDDYDIGDNFLDPYIEEAYYRKIPIIVAAGNSSENVSTMYPASSAKAIAVSAVKKSGKSVTFDHSYSNYGGKIAFCGPGTDILSASKTSNSKRKIMSGTSMAAPHITAAFAWMKMLYPHDSVAQLYKRMKRYSVDLGKKGKDIYYGNGLPKIRNLLKNYRKEVAQAKEKRDIAKLKKYKVNLLKVKSLARKELVIKWAPNVSVDGYQICFSRSKKFSGTKRTVKIVGGAKERRVLKKLASGKMYFVKVRAYKVINKKTRYSSWSKVKSAKIK